MIFFCDDIGYNYANQLHKLERLKKRYPQFKVNCSVIAKYLDDDLIGWLQKDWVEVVVHGYEHGPIPECELSEREDRIKKALAVLRPLLPEKFGFRAPGFQMTASTYPILRESGFWYIAHQTRIQPLKQIDRYEQDRIVNSHIYDKLNYEFKEETRFKFASEGF